MITLNDIKKDVAKNMKPIKKKLKPGDSENIERDILFRIDLKLSLEDRGADVIPSTKLKRMQNRAFAEKYPYIEEFDWEVVNKELKAKVTEKVDEIEKAENRKTYIKQGRGYRAKKKFPSPGRGGSLGRKTSATQFDSGIEDDEVVLCTERK
jgi:hypothetical protein